jgi:uncharacterized membrane protein required for colicin V production
MWYDLLTLLILMFAMFRGAMKGIVWQLATIAALLMCFFFSGSCSSIVAPFIRVQPPLDRWIAMLILYLGFSFVSFGVARVMHEWIEQMKFDALDRHLGAALGLVKGAVFSLFLTFFLVTLSHSARESIINSESGYAAAVIIDRLDPVIPGDLHALLEPYLERLDAPEIEREHRDERIADDHRDRDEPRREDLDRRDPFDSGDRVDRHDPDRRREIDGVRGDDRYSRDEDHRDDAIDRRRDVPHDDMGRREITDGRRPDNAFDDADPDRAARDRDRRGDDDRLDRPPLPDSASGDYARESSEESEWLSSLPGTLTADLRRLALKVWRSTRPERRDDLRRRLSSTVPEMIEQTIRDLANGLATAGDVNPERGRLERDVVRALANTDQATRTDDIERSLRGIPDEVAMAVLRDWRADLLDRQNDPDSETTSQTSLNDRIRRQLKRAGVSVRSLDTATQDRLLNSDTR